MMNTSVPSAITGFWVTVWTDITWCEKAPLPALREYCDLPRRFPSRTWLVSPALGGLLADHPQLSDLWFRESPHAQCHTPFLAACIQRMVPSSLWGQSGSPSSFRGPVPTGSAEAFLRLHHSPYSPSAQWSFLPRPHQVAIPRALPNKLPTHQSLPPNLLSREPNLWHLYQKWYKKADTRTGFWSWFFCPLAYRMRQPPSPMVVGGTQISPCTHDSAAVNSLTSSERG